jgi:ATP-dependent Clp protease ATP-binding subunit ClpA
MPKINVYLPDDLADAVRDTGVPVSAICQRALEQAVSRMNAIQRTGLSDLDGADLADRLPSFTGRAVEVLTLAITRAKAAGAAGVTTGDLLHGILAEGGNLALQILTVSDVDPAALTAPTSAEPGTGDGLRFSRPAAAALELAVGEAAGLGHNYLGCEHLLIGLAAEPDGAAGTLLRSRGVDGRSTRRAVSTALAGYAHLRANIAPPSQLASLIERIERIERRLG